LRANKNFEFRWGNPPNMSIPHNYVIHGIDQSYECDTSIVRLNLIDNRVHLQANSAFSAYPHKSFSEIVKDVAGTYKNLPPAVVAEVKHLTDLTQTGSNHWAFLSALQREEPIPKVTAQPITGSYLRAATSCIFIPPITSRPLQDH
jgi:hypothetical protein